MLPQSKMERVIRCPWGSTDDPEMRKYHDLEWGVPVHDDVRHFEFLVLEGAQAGLSWSTILRKRDGYRKAFRAFDPKVVARYSSRRVNALLDNPNIIRNRRKIESAVSNARALLKVQADFGSFDHYAWRFVGGKPRQNHWKSFRQVPARTPESDAFSTDLKTRGFSFVGSTIIYAHMQAVGMVNDHTVDCFRHEEVAGLPSDSSSGRAADSPSK